MKGLISFVSFCVSLVLSLPVYSGFIPKPNGESFGLQYGESIAGIAPSKPKIDGVLDDWRYAVWIAFDSENELFRGRGAWKGKEDLSVTWSTMYDDKNFYFAAAVMDDEFAPANNPAEPWRGDCIFLYIDWVNNKVEIGSKPAFAMVKDQPMVFDFSGGKNPRIGESKIAMVKEPSLGKGGMIYEVEMPFEFLTKETIQVGRVIGFTPGYEEGTDNTEGKGGLVFMDWGGVDPDKAQNLGKLKFSDRLSVKKLNKAIFTWGGLKSR